MSSKILLRRGTAAQWSSANPILGTGELGIETDTLKIKIGNGTSTWSQLSSYANVTPAQLTSEINNLISAAPATLDTLNELAAAINNDASFSTTVNNLLTGKVSKSGGDTITSSTASTVGLIVKAAASQTANVLEIKDSANNNTLIINSANRFHQGNRAMFGTDISFPASLSLGASASLTGFIIRGAASQTADLQQWQNSAGTVLANIKSNGAFNIGVLQTGQFYTPTDTGPYLLSDQYGWSLINRSTVGTNIFTIKGMSGQTGNLQEWQNSAGAVRTAVASDGRVIVQPNAIQTLPSSALGYITIGNENADEVSDWTKGLVFADTYVSPGWAHAAIWSMGSAGWNGNLLFGTDNTGNNTSSVTERMRITAPGLVLINTTSSTLGSGSVASQLGVVAGAATTVGLVVRAAASQTANLQEWQNSAGYAGTAIDSGGSFYAPGIYSSYLMQATAGGAAVVPFTVKGAASQTANLQEWQSAGGTVLSNINSAGAANFVRAGIGGTTPGTTPLFVTSPNASYIATIIRAASGQTANLQEWQNSSGTVLAKIDANGQGAFKSTTLTASSSGGSALTLVAASGQTAPLLTTAGGAQISSGGNYFIAPGINATYVLSVTSGGTAVVPFTVTGIASQSANLQEWKNSTGTVLASVSSTGRLLASSNLYTNSGQFGDLFNSPGGTVAVINAAANTIGINVKAHGSQTANLQQWINSSNTALAAVTSSGSIWASSMTVATSGAVTAGSQFGVVISSASTVGVGIKAATSQTADLQQWQNSAGTVMVKIAADGSQTWYNSSNGNVIAEVSIYGEIYAQGNMYVRTAGNYGASLNVTTPLTTYIGAVIRGISGQTANLQEWQNSSGTVLASLGSSGVFTSAKDVWHLSTDSRQRLLYAGDGASIYKTYTSHDWRNASDVLTNRFDANGGQQNLIQAATTVGLTVKGAASQTADLQQWQDSTGANLALMTSGGFLHGTGFRIKQNANSTISSAQGSIEIQGPTVRGLVIVAATSQTANLQEWQNSSGTLLSRVGSDGTVQVLSLNTSSYISDTSATRPYIDFTVANKLIINTRNAGYVGLTVKGSASQTADLQQWQNSAGTVLSRIDSLGIGRFPYIRVGSTLDGLYVASVWNSDPALVVLAIRAATSQTANLQEWQNSSGTLLSRITSSGQLAVPNVYSVNGSGAFIAMNSTSGAVVINTNAAGNIGTIIRGSTSQTADLQQWQDSAGTVLANVQSGGLLSVGNTTGTIQVTSSGTSGSYPSSGAGIELVAGADSATDLIQAYNRGTNAWRNLDVRTGKTSFLSQFASSTVLIVKGYASQTANLQEWQNSAGTVNAKIAPNGDFTNNGIFTVYGRFGGASFTDAAALRVNGYSTSVATAIIKGIASQTANLQEWQNSAGTALVSVQSNGRVDFQGAYIDQYGQIVTNTTLYANNVYHNLNYWQLKNDGSANFNSQSATVIPLTVKGAASQTGDLQQWQNSSGAVLAEITASGSLELNGKDIELMNIMGAF